MHYSHAQTPLALTKWSRAMAKVLTKHYSKGETVPIFVYTGMSGVATATALFLALAAQKKSITYGMMYVRKKDEDSHGQPIETCMSEDCGSDVYDLKTHPHEFVFVDDFICAGNTLVYCALTYQKHMDELLIFSKDSFVVLTGERREPVFDMTPMFGDKRAYKGTPKELNRIMLDDHNIRVKAKKESMKALKKLVNSF